MESPYDKYLNPIIQFTILEHLYTKTILKPSSGNYLGMKPIYSIHQAKQEIEYPSIIIFDKKGYIDNTDKELALTVIDEETQIREYINFISPKSKKTIKQTLEQNGYPTPKDDNELVKSLTRSHICYRPITKIRDIWKTENINWQEFITKIIQWEATNKDPRLNAIHKAQLLEGLDPRLNAHALVVLNAGVGKSIHFHIHGVQIDKATRKSFLGFAKSPDEIYPGTVANSKRPIGIDQIEVGEWGILDFMFNVMEYGEGTVSAGATKFTVKSMAPFTLNANPIEDKLEPEKNFGYVLDHLTKNPAIGRRFGIIAYGTDYNVLNTKSSPESLRAWKKASSFFRAIEQYAKPTLNKIKENPDIWEWLNKPIPGYREKIEAVTKTCQDSTIRQFFREHGKAGQSRVRAAALQCSLVDHLQDIAFERHTIEGILDHAEDILPTFIQVNIESANNIVRNTRNITKFNAETFLNSQPAYIKEIIYAIEFTRRQDLLGHVFTLNDTEYKPQSNGYTYISQCVTKLAARKRGIVQLNSDLKRHFKFHFELKNRVLEIIFHDKNPVPWMQIPGIESEAPMEPESEAFDVELTPHEKRSLVYDFISKNGGASTDEIQNHLGLTKNEITLITSAGKRDGLIYNHLGKWGWVN